MAMLNFVSLPFGNELLASLRARRCFPNAHRSFVKLASSVIPQAELSSELYYRWIHIFSLRGTNTLCRDAAHSRFDCKYFRRVRIAGIFIRVALQLFVSQRDFT